MKELSRGAQRLFELARKEEAPEPGTEARIERALAARIALGLGAGGASTTVATAAAASKLGSATLASIAAKALLVGLTTGSVVIGAATVVSSTGSPSSVGRERPVSPVAVEGLVPASRARSAPSPSDPETVETAPRDAEARALRAAPLQAREQQRARAPLPSDVPASDSVDIPVLEDPLDAETESLRAAQAALRDRDFERALGLLNDQDALYRSGSLQQERAAARVLASCLAGQVERARAEAAHFERRWPRSPLLARVQRSCTER